MTTSSTREPAPRRPEPEADRRLALLHWIVTGVLVLAGIAYVTYQHPKLNAPLNTALTGGTLLLAVLLAVRRRP